VAELSPGRTARLLAGLAVLSTLYAVPCAAHAWSSFRVEAYTLDLSVESEHAAQARLTLEIEVLGGRFRGFKIARGDEGLAWSASALFCENSSGKRFVLRRVPRADGLTDFRFVTPGFIPRGTLDMLILKTISLVPMHGLGISRRIEQITDGVFQVKPGSLFPALHRMEQEGWIKGEWGESENKRRARYYSLTATGQARLGEEKQGWSHLVLTIGKVLEAN